MTLSEAELTVRQRLDNWRLWVGIAYFGLVAVVIALFFLNRDISREQAKSQAEQQATNISQVTTCANAVKNAPDVAAILDAVRFTASDRLEATRAAIAAAPADDPLVGVRLKSVARLEDQLTRIGRVSDRIKANTPTPAKCNALARKTGVPLPFPKA